MSKSEIGALQHSDLNDFLFADVGIEANGMTLTVLSTLARVGLDPWREAGRLAKLPSITAVDGLARIIAGMPTSRWSLPDATSIAARLIVLLPARGSRPPSAASRDGTYTTTAAESLRGRLAAVGTPTRTRGTAPARSFIRWIAVLAVLGGLLVGMSLSLAKHSDDAPIPSVPLAHDVPTAD